MTDAKAHRIATDVHNCVRDEIVQAIDAVDAIPCDGTAKSYEAIEKAKEILHKADCTLTKLYDGHCPCDRCNPVKREQPQSLMRRIGMVHG